MDKIVIANKYQLVGLAEPGEFQFGGDGVVYNHNSLTEEDVEVLIDKGYPNLKPLQESEQKAEETADPKAEEATEQSTGTNKKKQPQQ